MATLKIRLNTLFNSQLDRLVRLKIPILGRHWPAYQVFGYSGFGLAVLQGVALALGRGLSPWMVLAIALTAALTFFGLAFATKVIAGEEQLIYYHHEIAIMAAAALLVWLLGQPVLPYLDLTILGVGLFLAFGRLGCLLVGCCHGRPHRWGLRYSQRHADAGFPAHYVGVRLFPIQAVESLFVFSVVLAGAGLVLTGHPPGEALSWYVVSYGTARFCFEFARGDLGRPELLGFSEAQLTSVLLMGATVWAQLAEILIFHPWHAAATLGLVLTMIALGLNRRRQSDDRHRLLHPRHVKEVAQAIQLASGQPLEMSASGEDPQSTDFLLGCTSLGLRISASKIRDGGHPIDHYAFSLGKGALLEPAARALSRLILQLSPPSLCSHLVPGAEGVFHLLLRRRHSPGSRAFKIEGASSD